MKDFDLVSITRATSIREALSRLDASGIGILLLVDEFGFFERTVTDGDIRRLLLKGVELDEPIDLLGQIQSIVLRVGFTRADALHLLNEHEINHLPVLDTSGRAIRLLSRQDLDAVSYTHLTLPTTPYV